jgi:hypothetical protein
MQLVIVLAWRLGSGDNMAHLSIRLLGSLQVTLDDEPITAFESDKVRALLAYLATESALPHRRERLAGLQGQTRVSSLSADQSRNDLAMYLSYHSQ